MTFNSAMTLWIVSTIISTIFSESPFHSLLRSTFTALILLTAVVFHLKYHILRQYIRLFCALAVIVISLASLGQVVNGTHLEPGPMWRARGILPHPNDLAIIPVLLPFVSMVWWPLGILGVFLSASRNAMLGLFTVVFIISSWKWRCITLATAFVGLLLMTYYHAGGGFTARLGGYAVATKMFISEPAFGHGPHTFVDNYFHTIVQREKPYGFTPNIDFIPWAHSLYFEMLSERGILGLLAFSLPLVWSLGVQRLNAAVAAFLVMGIFDLTFLKPWVVGAYWLLVTTGLTEREVMCGKTS